MLTDPLAYFLESFFITFLQTIAFFIVAARYDTLQKRREFLIKIERIFILNASDYIGKDWSIFQKDVVCLFSELRNFKLFGTFLLINIETFLFLVTIQIESKKMSSKKITEKEFTEITGESINYLLDLIRRKCKWTGFTNLFTESPKKEKEKNSFSMN